jgi:hypothetical protein
VFVCAYVAGEDDEDSGSDMLYGWIGFLVLGYAILPIKSLILPREPKILAVQKSTIGGGKKV